VGYDALNLRPVEFRCTRTLFDLQVSCIQITVSTLLLAVVLRMAAPSISPIKTPPKPVDVAIIGGGISGLAILLGLLANTSPAQVRPHIYEADFSFAEIGAGLSFTPNCIAAMKMLEPRLLAAYWAAALPKAVEKPGEGNVLRKPELYFVTGVKGKEGKFECFERVFEQKVEEAGGPGLHRNIFLDLLAGLVPTVGGEDMRDQGPYVSFGKKLVGIDELGDNDGVQLTFEDGSIVSADAVIGCDGINGLTRRIMLERNGEPDAVKPKFSGKFCYRGLIPLGDPGVRESIPEEIQWNMIFQLAYGAHMFAYPIRNGEFLNVVATHKTDTGTWPYDKWVVPSSKRRLEADMEFWGPPARAVFENMKDADMWALFESQPCKSFYRKGKICLMGDCAHATTPHQGAGASQCIEDALVLSKTFGLIESGSQNDIGKVFRAYDAVRRPRSQKVIETSNSMSAIASFEGEGTGDDLDSIKESLKSRFSWLWHADLEELVEEAKRVYRSA
jgi:salicylate hydroxylase